MLRERVWRCVQGESVEVCSGSVICVEGEWRCVEGVSVEVC